MKKILVSCLLLLTGSSLSAQQIKHVLKFEIVVPDTVIQGESFNVDYILDATHYSGYVTPDFKGCRVLDRFFPTSTHYVNKQKYNKLECNYRLITSQTGLLKLPPHTMVVNKKKVYSTAKTIYVKSNPYYSKEINAAVKYLCSKGSSPDSCNLELKQRGAEYILFADDESRQFAVVATSDYFPYLDNPILAWGRESSIQNFKNSILKGLLDSYGKQLRQLAKIGHKYSSLNMAAYNPASTVLSPLLGKIAWGQSEPYNLCCPQADDAASEKTALVGCVAVSVAQIMGYHKYPNKGRGGYAYFSRNASHEKVLYTLNFHEQIFDWNKIKDTYRKNEADTAVLYPIARLMAASSVSVAADFGEHNTGADPSFVKMALVNFFGYSPTCSYVRGISDDVLLKLAYRELDNHRPFVVAGAKHAFVCDGYEGDFLHFNMGWEGYSNGYYRAMLVPDMNEKQLLFDSMIVGIEPEKKNLSKLVNVTTPGTLETLLTDEEKCTVNRLLISGEINGRDVALLRRMAGANDDKDYLGWRGALTMLDLSRANFVKDKSSYMTVEAKDWGYKAWSSTSYGNGYTKKNDYDFGNMDEKSWKRFCKDGLNKGQGYYFMSQDGKYYICFTTEPNVIGQSMFMNCDNLEAILLPKELEVIRDDAFSRCISLKSVSLPEQVKELGKRAFAYDRLLRKVTCTSQPKEKEDTFAGASPMCQGLVLEL